MGQRRWEETVSVLCLPGRMIYWRGHCQTPGSGSRMLCLWINNEPMPHDASIYLWSELRMYIPHLFSPHHPRQDTRHSDQGIRQTRAWDPVVPVFPSWRPTRAQDLNASSGATSVSRARVPGSEFFVTKVPTSVDVMSTRCEHTALRSRHVINSEIVHCEEISKAKIRM